MRLERCQCQPGCPEWTQRKFAPGHDSKMIGYIVREVREGRMSPERARGYAAARAQSAGLVRRAEKAIEKVRGKK